MKKGGYKIIDFKGTALSGTAVEIPGILEKIVDNYDKTILVSGVILNGELQDDAYAAVSDTENTVILTVYGGAITVTEDDEVTFAVAKTPAELTAEIGDLDNLNTTEKDSTVDAINEVNNKINDFFEPSTELTGSDDLDNIAKGAYFQNGLTMPAHTPTADCNNFVLYQFVKGPRLIQILISVNQNTIYYRTKAANVWSSWFSVDNTAIV